MIKKRIGTLEGRRVGLEKSYLPETSKATITGDINADVNKTNTIRKGVDMVRTKKETTGFDLVDEEMKYLRKSVDDVNDIIRPNQLQTQCK